MAWEVCYMRCKLHPCPSRCTCSECVRHRTNISCLAGRNPCPVPHASIECPVPSADLCGHPMPFAQRLVPHALRPNVLCARVQYPTECCTGGRPHLRAVVRPQSDFQEVFVGHGEKGVLQRGSGGESGGGPPPAPALRHRAPARRDLPLAGSQWGAAEDCAEPGPPGRLHCNCF